MFDIYPQDDPAQALRIKRFLMAAAAYSIWFSIALLSYFMGITTVSVYVVAGCFSGILLSNILVYAAIRSGYNKRFKDPSLTLQQMVIATFWTMVILYYADEARGAVLILYMVVFVFGLFKLNLMEFLYLSVFAVFNYTVVIVLLYKNRPDALNSKVDILNLIILAMLLPWFSFIGGYITKLKGKVNRSLNMVKETELKFRTIFDSASDGIAMFDLRKGKFTAANDKVCRMLGYTLEEFVNLKLSDLHPQESLKFVLDRFEKLNKGEMNIAKNIPITKKDGTTFYADISGSKITMAGREYSISVIRDISERRQAEALLKASEKQYRLLADNVTDIIFTLDLNLDFTYVSPSAGPVSGYSSDELREMKIKDMVDAETFSRFAEIFQEEMQTEKRFNRDLKRSRTLEYPLIRKNGATLWMEATLNFLRDANGAAIGIIGTARDITMRKLAEEALHRSEQRYQALSIIDDLTKLYNSRHFYAQLEKEIERSNRYQHPLSLLLLDLDKFKDFNDTFGHVEGDTVLSRLGEVVKRCLRDPDSAYRYGGEEFTIILPMTAREDAIVTAQRIQNEFRKEVFTPAPGKEVLMSMSIGVSQYKPSEDMKAFVHRVDQLMYHAKETGRDRICSE